ncbi:MAG: EAL domain-containing protein [Rhodoferax sp.]|nr:EAL domain-containing protein [Rhodoferax sp.]
MNQDTTAYDALIEFLHQAPIGLLQTALDGEITMINPMAASLLMPLAPDGNLVNLFDVLAPFAPGLLDRAAAHDRPGETICDMLQVTLPAIAAHGTLACTLGVRLLMLDASTLMATVTDMTQAVAQQQQQLAAKLRDMSRTDSLTAMPNRAVVLERITHALARARTEPQWQFAVLFINGDRFNRINATLGQAVGDELLRLMAGRLARLVRPGDALGRPAPVELTAARLSGDEFVVVMEGLGTAQDIHGVAQRLIDSLSRPYVIREHQVHLSASMGVVLGTQASGDADSVLQDASLAMRESKRAGGARYSLFEPAMKERAARNGSVESDLRQALAQGELFVAYQPIIGLAGGACLGVEALVRWRHPVRGTVPPIEFIEIAERTGLIGALGNFVLNQACREFVLWKRLLGARAPRAMSVNVSRAQLTDPTLTDQVSQALRGSGMEATELQLEITESLAAQDESVQQRLHELKALGVTLALDDFGTGYSSLACLHQLPVDVVKIDRSFVSQVETSHHHRVLVEATIMVARSLGMGTVAEGIETEAQATILTRLQCDKGQGYLFAKPLAADDMTRWLRERDAAQQRRTQLEPA